MINYLHSPIDDIAMLGLGALAAAVSVISEQIKMHKEDLVQRDNQIAKAKKDIEDCKNNQHLIEAEVEVISEKLKVIAGKINFKEYISLNIGSVRQTKGYKYDGGVIGYDELVIENNKTIEHCEKSILENKIKIKAYEARLDKINEYLNVQ